MKIIMSDWETEPESNENGIAVVYCSDNDDMQLPVEAMDMTKNDLISGYEYEMDLYFYLENLFFIAENEEEFKVKNPKFAPESSISFGIMNLEDKADFIPSPRIYMNLQVLHITTNDEYPHDDNILLMDCICQGININAIIVCNDKEDLPHIEEGNYISGEWWIEAYMNEKENETYEADNVND